MIPDNHKKLIAFLKRHRPVPPPPAAYVEEQLMELIQKQSTPLLRRRNCPWVVPGTIAAGAMLVVGGYRLLVPPLQAIAETQRLETFLITNWSNTVGNPQAAPAYSVEAEWLLLSSDSELEALPTPVSSNQEE